MKNLYTSTLFFLFAIVMQAQTFEFSLSFVGINSSTNNYQVALLATPSSMVTDGNTADMGAGFYLPTGLTIGNFVTGNSDLPASEWTSQVLGASNANGDPYFISRIEAGTVGVLLNGTDAFELVLFDIIADPNPTSGEATFVENGDPVFNEILFIENYININLGSGTINAYSQNDPSANSIEFSILNLTEFPELNNNISIYPNPASHKVSITSNTTIDRIDVYDILGKQVKTLKNLNRIDVTEINVTSLDSGLYLFKIWIEEQVQTKNIVIK
jgi:hypothetical protein